MIIETSDRVPYEFCDAPIQKSGTRELKKKEFLLFNPALSENA
jgi:hypothetical protein